MVAAEFALKPAVSFLCTLIPLLSRQSGTGPCTTDNFEIFVSLNHIHFDGEGSE